jgi:hypothetical protein
MFLYLEYSSCSNLTEQEKFEIDKRVKDNIFKLKHSIESLLRNNNNNNVSYELDLYLEILNQYKIQSISHRCKSKQK